MALGNNSSAIYVDIRNGKIFRYSKTEQEGTTPILNSRGEKKHYFIYDYIEGHVTGFSTREEEMQGTTKLVFQVHLTDGGENYVVKMGVETAYFRMLCSVMPNIDWSYPVRLIPRIKEENGVKKSSMIIVNNNNPVKFYFTKENPNGKPDIVVTRNKKNEIVDIDREDETQFFLNLVSQMKDKLSHPAVTRQPSTSISVITEEEDEPVVSKAPSKSVGTKVKTFHTDEDSNDLPF
jgi:hypothetical protein